MPDKSVTSSNNLKLRYEGLIKAVEFFTQKFEIQQLIDYAFQFTDDLLGADNIVVLVLDENQHYIPSHCKGYKEISLALPYSPDYDQIVYFHSGLLGKEVITEYFPTTLSESYPFEFCIPLVMETKLFGLICVSKAQPDSFSDDDKLIATALMNLFAIALTSYLSCSELKKTTSELNQKVFNLFAINHSTKALLSVFSLDKLCELAISVFSELTQSCITSFFLMNPTTESYKLMSYKNVFSHDRHRDMEIYKKSLESNIIPPIINLSDSKMEASFLDFFFNGDEVISSFAPRYIIAIINNNELLGFVTLSDKVNEKPYDKSIFELIESLASATYIAISNIRYIDQINTQKAIIDQKLSELIKLNQLMQNINSAQTASNTIKLLMDTLSVAFNVNLGFFAAYHENSGEFSIVESINMKIPNATFNLSQNIEQLLEGNNIIAYETNDVYNYFNKEITDSFLLKPSGCVIIPVYIADIETKLIGILVLLSVSKATLFSEENVLVFESISNYIAPVLYQHQEAEAMKKQYTPNYSNIFIADLKQEILECTDFCVELYVVHIYSNQPIAFDAIEIGDELLSKFKKIYPVNNTNCFILTNERPEMEVLSGAIDNRLMIKYYTFTKDFNNTDEFKSLF